MKIEKLHLEMHIDDEYRLTDDADNNWIGIIADEGANEIISMVDYVETFSWRMAYELANFIVNSHNQYSIMKMDEYLAFAKNEFGA